MDQTPVADKVAGIETNVVVADAITSTLKSSNENYRVTPVAFSDPWKLGKGEKWTTA